MSKLCAGILALFCLLIPNAIAGRVRGHTTKSGKYVAPHHRTNPNKTQRDNYSTKGNTNPYTGKRGAKTPKR